MSGLGCSRSLRLQRRATHSATLAVLIAIWFLAIPLLPLTGSRAFSDLLPAAGAIATGASMLLAANFALSGQPGLDTGRVSDKIRPYVAGRHREALPR